ncbi:MAG TPA: hypothetical protein VJ840_16310 [Gemmatimonadaceae bacterium]|nr:hypothetical protein [Gemmatimonadaceae bacterium]
MRTSIHGIYFNEQWRRSAAQESLFTSAGWDHGGSRRRSPLRVGAVWCLMTPDGEGESHDRQNGSLHCHLGVMFDRRLTPKFCCERPPN